MEFIYETSERLCKFSLKPRLAVGIVALLAGIVKGPEYLSLVPSILRAVGVGS